MSRTRFEYLVVNNDYIYGVRIDDDTMTFFNKNSKDSTGVLLAKDLMTCLYQGMRFNPGFKNIRHDDPEHEGKHFDDKESRLIHSHFKHAKQLYVKTVKKFLDEGASCKTSSGIHLLNHSIRKDIIKKYKDYYEKNRRHKLNSGEIYQASNDQFYNSQFNITRGRMPTLFQHAFCLTTSQYGCHPYNVKTPISMLNEYPVFRALRNPRVIIDPVVHALKNPTEIIDPTTLIITLSLTALALPFFCRRRKTKPQDQRILDTKDSHSEEKLLGNRVS